MSTMANVVLTDSVPTNRTFVPIKSEPISVWEDRTTPVTALGAGSLTGSVKKASTAQEVNRVTLRIAIPVEVTSTDTGVTTVVGYDRSNLEFITSADSTTLRRYNLLAMMRDLIDEAIVLEMARDLIQPS